MSVCCRGNTLTLNTGPGGVCGEQQGDQQEAALHHTGAYNVSNKCHKRFLLHKVAIHASQRHAQAPKSPMYYKPMYSIAGTRNFWHANVTGEVSTCRIWYPWPSGLRLLPNIFRFRLDYTSNVPPRHTLVVIFILITQWLLLYLDLEILPLTLVFRHCSRSILHKCAWPPLFSQSCICQQRTQCVPAMFGGPNPAMTQSSLGTDYYIIPASRFNACCIGFSRPWCYKTLDQTLAG